MTLKRFLPSLLLPALMALAISLPAQNPGGDPVFTLPGQSSDDEADMPLTTIAYSETNYDFGTISEGEEISHVFILTNSGDHDLVLERVKPSCSCAILEWPRGIIKPGETGEIKVVIDTQDKSGHQQKYLSIFYNGNPNVDRLSITGNIITKAKEPKEEKEEMEPREEKESQMEFPE